MAKREADNYKKIEIWWLKKNGYLTGGLRSGCIGWLDRLGNSKASIGITVCVWDDAPRYLELSYIQTDYAGNTKDFKYKVPIVTTRCHFGGYRYWFVCPLITDNQRCGRRVGVVYKAESYFGCRHCYNLTYASRNLSGVSRIGGKVISLAEVDQYRKAVKRRFYNGDLTKPYQRYLLKRRKSWLGLEAKLGAIGLKSGQPGGFEGELGN